MTSLDVCSIVTTASSPAPVAVRSAALSWAAVKLLVAFESLLFRMETAYEIGGNGGGGDGGDGDDGGTAGEKDENTYISVMCNVRAAPGSTRVT